MVSRPTLEGAAGGRPGVPAKSASGLEQLSDCSTTIKKGGFWSISILLKLRRRGEVQNQHHLEAFAFCATVDAIRKAQGKSNPEDRPFGSMERMLAEVDVIEDTLRMLGVVPDAIHDLPDRPTE